jgi:hypothetical protein
VVGMCSHILFVLPFQIFVDLNLDLDLWMRIEKLELVHHFCWFYLYDCISLFV